MGNWFLEDRKVVDYKKQELSNQKKYLEIMRTIDPELYLVKIALEDTGVNPLVLPRIIRAMANLSIGTGYGDVTILMKAGVLTQIKGSESDILNMSVDKPK